MCECVCVCVCTVVTCRYLRCMHMACVDDEAWNISWSVIPPALIGTNNCIIVTTFAYLQVVFGRWLIDGYPKVSSVFTCGVVCACCMLFLFILFFVFVWLNWCLK